MSLPDIPVAIIYLVKDSLVIPAYFGLILVHSVAVVPGTGIVE
jgi:hypothetical protein